MRPLMISRHVGRKWWWRVLITYNLLLLGQGTFGIIIANLISKGSPFQVWHVLKPFCYGCITNSMFTFHTYSNYIMGWTFVVHVHAKLWMVGLHWVPHLNQSTQASIKSYHNALKHWFSLETKGLKGRHIDWLMWRLTMTVAWHYMDQVDVHKKRNHGMICGAKCWENYSNSTHWCDLTYLRRGWWWWCLANVKPTPSWCYLQDSCPFCWICKLHLRMGICEATFASIKLLFYWLVPTLHQRISLRIAARIMELTVVVWNACLLTWHTYNWMMVRPMMKIVTMIQLMRLALLILGGLRSWMRIVVLTMSMCWKVHPHPWIEP